MIDGTDIFLTNNAMLRDSLKGFPVVIPGMEGQRLAGVARVVKHLPREGDVTEDSDYMLIEQAAATPGPPHQGASAIVRFTTEKLCELSPPLPLLFSLIPLV